MVRNSAENETWGECVGEWEICRDNGMVRVVGLREYRCTGGYHIGPGRFIRCTSSYHDQPGPMSPGIGILNTSTPHADRRRLKREMQAAAEKALMERRPKEA
jgi:hypothetical protein